MRGFVEFWVSVSVSSKLLGFGFGFDRNQKSGFSESQPNFHRDWVFIEHFDRYLVDLRQNLRITRNLIIWQGFFPCQKAHKSGDQWFYGIFRRQNHGDLASSKSAKDSETSDFTDFSLKMYANSRINDLIDFHRQKVRRKIQSKASYLKRYIFLSQLDVFWTQWKEPIFVMKLPHYSCFGNTWLLEMYMLNNFGTGVFWNFSGFV